MNDIHEIRLIRILMSIMAAAVMLIICTSMAHAYSGMSYLDWDEEKSSLVTRKSGEYIFASNNVSELNEGWYAVSGHVESGTVTVKGSVHIIIADLSQFYVGNLVVNTGSTLYIHAQSTGKSCGELKAESGTTGCAGIGGTKNSSAGDIFIYGGKITAKGGGQAAGIGGGQYGSSGSITIYGGEIDATGGVTGAGIGGGGGRGGNCGSITIYGGTINATDQLGAAAIGCGDSGEGGVITVYGGDITATTYESGTGIGAGSNASAKCQLILDWSSSEGSVLANKYRNIKVQVKKISDADGTLLNEGEADPALLANKKVKPKKYRITFVYQGVEQKTIYVIPNTIVEEPDLGLYDNVGMGRWCADINGNSEAYDFSKPVNEDCTLYYVAGKNIDASEIEDIPDQIYIGKEIKPALFITCRIPGRVVMLREGRDYFVSYADNINVGEATLTIYGNNAFTGRCTKTFRIIKAENPIKVKGKSVTVKYNELKKKSKVIKAGKAFSVSGGQGKVQYKKTSRDKKITVSKGGKVTIKKGLKKGTYKVKVKVAASGNDNYKASAKNVTVTVKVK